MSTRRQNLKDRLKLIEPIHFIGICGSGMSPLASVVKLLGCAVTGSDQAQASKLDPALAMIPFSEGHEDLHLVRNAKTVIVSSAIKPDTPELAYAYKHGLTVLHRSELLALISEDFKLISVAGTHGKSTTSALIAYSLTKLGLDPSYIIGARLKSLDDRLPSAHHLGTGEYLVIEADESDGSFERYKPYIAVVTNVDADHLDFHESIERIEESFARHLQNVNPEGLYIPFWDDPRLQNIAHTDGLTHVQRLTYGCYLGSEIRLLDFEQSGLQQAFHVVVEHKTLKVVLPLIGRHNALNALACLAVVRSLQLSVEDAAKALVDFPGVERRLDLYFSGPNALVYDDYAHNPAKVGSLIAGLRAAFPHSVITIVFQAHRYSRIRLLFQDFMTSFIAADHVVVVPVYAAGEPIPNSTEDFSPQRLAQEIAASSHVKTTACESLKEALKLLQLSEPSNHAVYATVGAGDVWTVAKEFAAHLCR